MEPLLEQELKQASYQEKAAIYWNLDDLIAWIRVKRSDLLDNDNIDKLRKAEVSGEVFLDYSGNKEFFQNDCKIAPGTAHVLAKLSRELAEEGIRKNKQQAEDVGMPEPPSYEERPRNAIDAFENGIRYQAARPLLETSGRNWEFQPHPELYKIIAPNLIEHFAKYKAYERDKEYAPMYFYLGGAGTGKSRHGTEFASSLRQAIELCKEEEDYGELLQRLEKAFVFRVSFENGTSLTPDESNHLWEAVGIRMLHQLVDGKLKDVQKKFVVTPTDVFELVSKAEGVEFDNFTGILVVDGIQNAILNTNDRWDKQSRFYKFLDQIGQLSLPWETEKKEAKLTPFIITCVTATFLGYRDQFLPTTHRKRVYLPLNRLDTPTWKYDHSKVLDDNPATRLLVNDVGGHARAIETIADEQTRYRNRPQPNMTEFADAVLLRLEDRYCEAIQVIGPHLLPVVQCILGRQQIFLLENIPGLNVPWEHITAPGLLWFETVGTNSGYARNRPGYLVAPYIWLWLLARAPTAGNTSPLRRLLGESQFNDYHQLLYLETRKGQAGQVTWQGFETFCCYFRRLRSLGFPNGREVAFADLHIGCKKLRDDRWTKVINRPLNYAEAAHQYSTKVTSTKDVVTRDATTLTAEGQLFHVILNGSSAPAGDFFFSIQTRPEYSLSSKIVREVGLCKFVQKKLDKETYTRERNKSAELDDFFMLYTTTKTPDDIVLPDRSGLVDESCWNSYFGPFAGRAYIASRYA